MFRSEIVRSEAEELGRGLGCRGKGRPSVVTSKPAIQGHLAPVLKNDVIAALQQAADRNIRKFGLVEAKA